MNMVRSTRGWFKFGVEEFTAGLKVVIWVVCWHSFSSLINRIPLRVYSGLVVSLYIVPSNACVTLPFPSFPFSWF